ncbi:5187_t:CDS:2 [Acaulospora colombiana]|uniref:5187_t:CDS:1 n=1 Tax=Acaulospora colombiana TaxID=27376 RepID=A0ACA9M2A0_9GLOM|nr:5187_t:CDS:2 [Acaulospora colombiana]
MWTYTCTSVFWSYCQYVKHLNAQHTGSDRRTCSDSSSCVPSREILALFMEASVYWVMILARFIQGASEKSGYRSPFILSMSVCAIDLVGRLLIIEKDEAAKWAEDTAPEVRQEANPDTASVLIKLLRSRRASIAILNGANSSPSTTGSLWVYVIQSRDHLSRMYGPLVDMSRMGHSGVPGLFDTLLASSRDQGKAYINFSSQLKVFFMDGVATPVTADLAAIARESEGIGCECGSQILRHFLIRLDAHTFGAFNLAYSGSNASKYESKPDNFIYLNSLETFYGSGSRPLLGRLIVLLRKDTADGDPDMVMGPVPAESTERPTSLHSQHQGSIRNVAHDEIIAEPSVKQA